MSNEWKMVPVEPTQEMLSSVDCNIDGLDPDGAKAQWDALLAAAPLLPSENFAAPGILINPTGYKVEHQAAPVPPAGDVEVVAEIGDLGFGRPWVRPIIDNPSLLPPMGTELVDRAHVTRLTAELDAERREHAETERISQQEELRANNYATQLVNAQSELTKVLEELRLEKVAGAAMHKQAEDFKALSWERGQELTKARELLSSATGQLEVCSFALREVATSKAVTSVNLRQMAKSALNSAAAIFSQSAPAAKGGHCATCSNQNGSNYCDCEQE